MTIIDTKAPPHSDRIERMILGIYLDFPESQNVIDEAISYEWFHDSRHSLIYKYIYIFKNLNNDSPVDTTNFLEWLEENPEKMKQCGGRDYLIELADGVVTSVGVRQAVEKLKDLFIRRDLIGKCHGIINACYDNRGIPIGEIISDMRIVKEYQTRSKSLAEEVRSLIKNATGSITTTYVYSCLQISDRKDKKNVSIILARLEKEGLLEKTRKRAGEYRIVEEVGEFEDWLDADEAPLSFRLPFAMERYVEIYPGDIIIYAGVNNTGKSALAFETIKLNMREMRSFYFSSEIRKEMFKRRLSLSEDLKVEQWKVKFKGDLTIENAPDRIQKDCFNTLDYIEPTDGEYFKIAGAIAEIHRKLGKGVALICLQKNKGSDYAIGGQQTLAKPSLYCTLDPDTPGSLLTVRKCKAFRGMNNPNGWEIRYKIVNGITLKPQGIFGPDALIMRG